MKFIEDIDDEHFGHSCSVCLNFFLCKTKHANRQANNKCSEFKSLYALVKSGDCIAKYHLHKNKFLTLWKTQDGDYICPLCDTKINDLYTSWNRCQCGFEFTIFDLECLHVNTI